MASEWLLIESAPLGVFLRTRREGESGENVSMLVHGDEWVDREGRTTVTHSTFAAPTHWMPLPERSK